MINFKNKIKIFNQSRGGIEILILVLIVLGSILMAGGLFPKLLKGDPNAEKFIAIPEIPQDTHSTLQLKTIKFKSCTSAVAVNFLVDRSGSMRYGTKLQNLQSALRVFANNYPDDGIIGMQSFSEPALGPTADVPIDYFRNVESQFSSAISALFPDGGTYTRDAFSFVKPRLDAAKSKFSNYKFSLIFISDGVPETLARNNAQGACQGTTPEDLRYCGLKSDGNCRCFDTSQDPTLIANEIKNSGVRIFSIGYINDEDLKFKDDLTTLMKNVASSPNDFYEAPIDNQLTDILSQISQKLCN